MGQLTQNVVARNIYMTSLTTTGLASNTDITSGGTGSLYATNQAGMVGTASGLRNEYYWGLYRFCAGDGVNGDRSCSERYIGYRWEPIATLEADASGTYETNIASALGDSYATNNDRLALLSRVANVILLVGTILTGLAFLTGFLAHRFCFAFAALQALGATGCLAVAAAIWTAILKMSRDALPADFGAEITYGNGLWMTWGAFAAVAASIIPLLLACCLGGRSKY